MAGLDPAIQATSGGVSCAWLRGSSPRMTFQTLLESLPFQIKGCEYGFRSTHELKKAEVEPLLPIEKKLIGFSLGLGIFLLIVLAVINHFLPVS